MSTDLIVVDDNTVEYNPCTLQLLADIARPTLAGIQVENLEGTSRYNI